MADKDSLEKDVQKSRREKLKKNREYPIKIKPRTAKIKFIKKMGKMSGWIRISKQKKGQQGAKVRREKRGENELGDQNIQGK